MKHLKLKRSNSKIVLLIGVSFFLLIQCLKYKESTPFFDGEFLEYNEMGDLTIYSVQALGNKFKITETRKREPLSKLDFRDVVAHYAKLLTGKQQRHRIVPCHDSRD